MSFDQAIAVAKAVAEVAAAVAWPLVIMILVCVFYKPITSLLSRVREIKASGVEVLVDRLEEQETSRRWARGTPGFDFA